jgi:hypothetical protein
MSKNKSPLPLGLSLEPSLTPIAPAPLPIPYPNIAFLAEPPPVESLPPELQVILTRLGREFGVTLRTRVTTAGGVEIRVDGVSPIHLYAQVELERKALFGDADGRVQVIKQPHPIGDGGAVFLHLLSEPTRSDRVRR